MVARFLVTTALEDTWPEDDVPLLLLGEWCCRYDRKSSWENRDAIVAPYHWDDRWKLQKDYRYLQALYEELLQQLASQLNELHRVDHSVRYWRIIVGPWLGYFIQMLFDRWAMLQHVVLENEIYGVRVLKRGDGDLVPNDMSEFITLFTGDVWNELIYSQILQSMGVAVEKVNAEKEEYGTSRVSKTVSPSRRLKRILRCVANHISCGLYRDDDYFFISSYLSVMEDLILQAKLGQFPKLWQSVAVPVSAFDRAVRQWQVPKLKCNDEFKALACALIPNHIPKAYVEGYQELVALTNNLPWPKKPSVIFTSVSFNADNVFQAWAANMVEGGVPLVIGQHGGNYGMALWNFNEDHQLAIADRFLSWGWNKPEQSNVIPVGNFKGFSQGCVADKSGIALMVEMTLPRQSYHMYSAPVAAGQWTDYFEDQCRFVHSIPESLRHHLMVRLASQDYGLIQRRRWRDRFLDIQLDDGEQPIAALLKKTRLYISTYNATTYLESLSLNFPTIMFWNPKHWELRDSALPHFEKLKSAGIFHETPESAARQMAVVWNDVVGWWQSTDVQLVRHEFCEQYAKTPAKIVDELKKVFCGINGEKSR